MIVEKNKFKKEDIKLEIFEKTLICASKYCNINMMNYFIKIGAGIYGE
ncbi:hypothetical protein LJ207_09935 [Halanaerobium sp. Z-7514]|uniref:Uncharacterized protein n=1 Tax=Halanaerobium polyolivorans TaxID=2886943 RepID=A0AAW4X1K3_9FIRM|nr:hypothetical protein [Halanaerobium polyolivorans]MCC3145643.1 hypothetical protein [Halanaerobium polyolivorans]